MSHKKRMKYPITVIGLISILAISSLSGCSKSNDKNNTSVSTTTKSDSDSKQETSTKMKTVGDVATTDENAEVGSYESLGNFIGKDLELFSVEQFDIASNIEGYGFENGVIWGVDRSSRMYMMINTDGEAVYAVSGNFDPEIHRTGDGFTYIELTSSEDGQNETQIEVIVDSSGEETCRLVSDDSNIYHIIGYSDGKFIVMYTYQDMDTNKVYLYAIDSEGNIITEPKEVGDVNTISSYVSAKNLGDNIFVLSDSGSGVNFNMKSEWFYNADTGALIKTDTPITVLGNFYDGKTVVLGKYGYYWIESKDFTVDHDNYSPGTLLQMPEAAEYTSYLNGKIFGTNKDDIADIFDSDEKSLGWVDSYQQYSYLSVYPQNDGYIVVSFRGADEKDYLTVLDEEGKELYSPMGTISEYGDTEYIQAGYIHQSGSNDGLYFIYPDGSSHKWNEDLSEMNELCGEMVGDGYIVMENSDTAWEGWDSSSVYRFSSLKQRDWVSVQILNDTKISDFSDLTVTKAPDGILSSAGDVDTQDDVAADDSEETYESLEGVTLFDQDGVTITVDSKNNLEVINNNPENKKLKMSLDSVAYNGIVAYSSQTIGFNDLQSGSSEYLKCPEYDQYINSLTTLSHNYSELPLMEARYDFSLQIGSDGETKDYAKTIRLTNYDESKLEPFFSNKIGDYTTSDGRSISAYRVETDLAAAVLIQNDSDANLSVYNSGMNPLIWFMNGERLNDEARIQVDLSKYNIAPTTCTIYHFDEGADSIRKRKELTNDTDIDMTLRMYYELLDEAGSDYIEVNLGIID